MATAAFLPVWSVSAKPIPAYFTGIGQYVMLEEKCPIDNELLRTLFSVLVHVGERARH